MAHITMNAADVALQCTKVISFIEARRKEKKQQAADKMMAKTLVSFHISWPFIRKYHPTVQQYIDNMECMDGLVFNYTFAKDWRDRDYALAHSLLMLSELGNPITITDKDVRLWQNY